MVSILIETDFAGRFGCFTLLQVTNYIQNNWSFFCIFFLMMQPHNKITWSPRIFFLFRVILSLSLFSPLLTFFLQLINHFFFLLLFLHFFSISQCTVFNISTHQLHQQMRSSQTRSLWQGRAFEDTLTLTLFCSLIKKKILVIFETKLNAGAVPMQCRISNNIPSYIFSPSSLSLFCCFLLFFVMSIIFIIIIIIVINIFLVRETPTLNTPFFMMEFIVKPSAINWELCLIGGFSPS